MSLSKWLPVGRHWGLEISHRPLPDAGDFTGGGHKLVWHTTEGEGIQLMWSVLRDKNAAPHFLIDPSKGVTSVIQMIALDRAGRALVHPAGTPETNRANAIQVEIVDYAAHAGQWQDWVYRDLAALAALTDHRFNVPPYSANFRKPVRMGQTEFVKFAGHCGHVHVPGNDHTDPGHMSGEKLLAEIGAVERQYK